MPRTLDEIRFRARDGGVASFPDHAGGGVQTLVVFPRAADWPAGRVADHVNPRSHDEAAVLDSRVARAIRATLTERPAEFAALNRGVLLLASSTHWDGPDLVVRFAGDARLRGLADGGTTDAVLAAAMQVQEGHPASPARVRVEVIAGLDDPDRVLRLVEARNTSRQVAVSSLANLAGRFDWLKSALPDDVRGWVAWEENAAGVPVSDLLGLLGFFRASLGRPEAADGGDVAERTHSRWSLLAPEQYRHRGKLPGRLRDAATLSEYQALAGLAADVARLHDALYLDLAEWADRQAEATRSPRTAALWEVAFPAAPGLTPYVRHLIRRRVAAGWLFPAVAAAAAFVRDGAWVAPLADVRRTLFAAAAGAIDPEVRKGVKPDSFARLTSSYGHVALRAAAAWLTRPGQSTRPAETAAAVGPV